MICQALLLPNRICGEDCVESLCTRHQPIYRHILFTEPVTWFCETSSTTIHIITDGSAHRFAYICARDELEVDCTAWQRPNSEGYLETDRRISLSFALEETDSVASTLTHALGSGWDRNLFISISAMLIDPENGENRSHLANLKPWFLRANHPDRFSGLRILAGFGLAELHQFDAHHHPSRYLWQCFFYGRVDWTLVAALKARIGVLTTDDWRAILVAVPAQLQTAIETCGPVQDLLRLLTQPGIPTRVFIQLLQLQTDWPRLSSKQTFPSITSGAADWAAILRDLFKRAAHETIWMLIRNPRILASRNRQRITVAEWAVLWTIVCQHTTLSERGRYFTPLVSYIPSDIRFARDRRFFQLVCATDHTILYLWPETPFYQDDYRYVQYVLEYMEEGGSALYNINETILYATLFDAVVRRDGLVYERLWTRLPESIKQDAYDAGL